MSPKILSPSQMRARVRLLRFRGKKVVFTNGTFDVLHLGHVRYLEKAKTFGDILVIGVNSDRSVKTYKSPDRPVNSEKDRMEVLAALAAVDYVVLFSDPTPLKLIMALKPDVLIKGADWKKKDIAGAAEVESWGGKVRRIPLVKGRSTTSTLKKINRL